MEHNKLLCVMGQVLRRPYREELRGAHGHMCCDEVTGFPVICQTAQVLGKN